jgi:multidrug efflux system membrane fusion protein
MSLPLSALTQRQGRPAVWVVDGRSSRVHLTNVTIGPYGEAGVPVLSGIGPEDWVVAAGAHLLLEGEQIAPIDRDNRPVRIGASGSATKPAGN